jgi:phosphohistidine swiveling domain-containing protein
LKKGKEYLIMQQKPRALSVLLATALAIAALPFAGAAAAPLAQDLEAPVVSGLTAAPSPVELGAEVTINATVDDLATGGSDIQSAEYNLNGGAFVTLAASDGAFDSPTEVVTGLFTVAVPGDYEVCVVGTDSAGLTSAPVCTEVVAQETQAPVVTAVAGAPNPAALGDAVTVTATVDDAATGGSNIQSAEFSVNGGTFAALAAFDGAFDSPTENVTGSFNIEALGAHEICVKGTDAAGNVSTEACATITAESQIEFEGFYPPVKMPENFVKAGRTIPVKFSLEDLDGAPISMLTTFAGLYSYEVDCESLAGEPATAVQESSPGNAAVRAFAGDWIALWKTPKSYADSCRVMYVLFNDGSTSPEVLFRFR